jgi:predicted RNase H-like nuclease (RuvC/YqgF family)
MEDDNEESRWEKVEEIIDGLKYDMRKMKKKIKTLEEQMEEHTRKSNAGEFKCWRIVKIS